MASFSLSVSCACARPGICIFKGIYTRAPPWSRALAAALASACWSGASRWRSPRRGGGGGGGASRSGCGGGGLRTAAGRWPHRPRRARLQAQPRWLPRRRSSQETRGHPRRGLPSHHPHLAGPAVDPGALTPRPPSPPTSPFLFFICFVSHLLLLFFTLR